MKEIRQQLPPEASEEDAQFENTEIETLRLQFEVEWAGNRWARTFVENEKGERIVHEAYKIPLYKDPSRNEAMILQFCRTASVLGYHTDLAPVFTHKGRPKLLTFEIRGFIHFFISRAEP